MDDIVISVITAVYNRANEIHRVFESLEKSTYRKFELVLIDDGSEDNIIEIVNDYKYKVSFPIIFIQKENGGYHTALNIGYEHAKGEYIFSLDSDDEIMPDAMEIALNLWESIPTESRGNYWTVCGRYINYDTNQMIGKPFPDNINSLGWTEQKKILELINGDKMALKRLSILKQYKLPEPPYVKSVDKGLIWRQINMKYRELYTNHILGIVHTDSSNRLTIVKRNKNTMINRYYNTLYVINRQYIYKSGLFNYLKLQLYLTYCRSLIPSTVVTSLEKLHTKHKIINILLYPILYYIKFIYYIKYGHNYHLE